MKYLLPVGEHYGDLVPLVYVAETMAREIASQYGTVGIDMAALKSALSEREGFLLKEAQLGNLKVTNYLGDPQPVDRIINEARLSGALIEQTRYVNGEKEFDEAGTFLQHLYSKWAMLNEWGKNRCDEFAPEVGRSVQWISGTSGEWDYRDGECIETKKGIVNVYRKVIGGRRKARIVGGNGVVRKPSTAPTLTGVMQKDIWNKYRPRINGATDRERKKALQKYFKDGGQRRPGSPRHVEQFLIPGTRNRYNEEAIVADMEAKGLLRLQSVSTKQGSGWKGTPFHNRGKTFGIR